MTKIKSFLDFRLDEVSMAIADPSTAGDRFAEILANTKNVKESPVGSNSGPEVNSYLKSVGLGPGEQWCAAYVYAMFDELSKRLGVPNTLIKTGHCLTHWKSADPSLKINIADARKDMNQIKPGMVFMMKRGGGDKGHTGIVVSVDPSSKTFTSIEGNTNDQKSGEGDRVGVNKRSFSQTNLLGFIDYFKGRRTPEFDSDISKALGTVAPYMETEPVIKPQYETPGEAVAGKEPPATIAGKILGGLAKSLGYSTVTSDSASKFLGGN